MERLIALVCGVIMFVIGFSLTKNGFIAEPNIVINIKWGIGLMGGGFFFILVGIGIG